MRTFNRIKSFSLVFYAEVGRTFQERITYRTQLVLGLLTGVVGLAQFAILGYYISLGGTPPGLEQYGGNIIAFMIVGSLFSALAVMMMNSLKMQIQSEQKRGTLEAIALSRAGLFKFLIAGGVFGLVMTLISSVAIFAIFGHLFDFELKLNPIGLVVSVAFTVVCMWAIGLCAAAYILVSKQGEPVTWVVTTLLTLFSGVMYPISVFPDVVASAASYLPTAGMLHSIRLSLFSGAPTFEVLKALMPTIATTALLIPLGVVMWRKGVHKVRVNGTLGTY